MFIVDEELRKEQEAKDEAVRRFNDNIEHEIDVAFAYAKKKYGVELSCRSFSVGYRTAILNNLEKIYE